MKKYASLSEYLKKTGTTHGALAKRLGVSRPYVTLIAKGDRQPSLTLALRIADETGVPAAALASEAVA